LAFKFVPHFKVTLNCIAECMDLVDDTVRDY